MRAWFPDDAACLDYLEWLRWPEGFECPQCKTPGHWRMADGCFWCALCRRRVSVTTGTIFHGTRTPLTVWFEASWCVTSAKNGVSAKTLQRLLGFGSYQTAWTMLHRFRTAMVRPGREQLRGRVEVDETYLFSAFQAENIGETGGSEFNPGSLNREIGGKRDAGEALEPAGESRGRPDREPGQDGEPDGPVRRGGRPRDGSGESCGSRPGSRLGIDDGRRLVDARRPDGARPSAGEASGRGQRGGADESRPPGWRWRATAPTRSTGAGRSGVRVSAVPGRSSARTQHPVDHTSAGNWR